MIRNTLLALSLTLLAVVPANAQSQWPALRPFYEDLISEYFPRELKW